ncbi:MAG: glycosyltransferase family 39 protein [Archangium sp.]|nr:glycosyltransferase family 39 protein [Archangium sp.]
MPVVALLAIAFVAFALRAFPFLGADGAWSYRVDYDEGVYFSAAAWMIDGALPWRDYVFVHPPGHLLFLVVTSVWTKGSLGIAGAFALSRWIAAIIGAINAFLVGRVVARTPNAPLPAGLIAAAMYATYPEVVQVERGPFMEPLLNLLCLVLVLLSIRQWKTTRAMVLMGVVAGAALGVKLWAILWVLGVLLTLTTRRERITFSIATAVTATLIIAPFALRNLGEFMQDALLFHLWRPADGTLEATARLEQIVSVRHLASPILALIAVVVLRRRSGVAGVAWVLTIASFFASAAWWNQYNAHLIASEAVLVGLAFIALPERFRMTLVVAATASIVASVTHTIRRAASTGEHLIIARSELGKSSDCLFSFEPAWAIAANRLPPRETGPLVDSYATQLLTAIRGTGAIKTFAHANDAFAAVSEVPKGLSTCRYLFIGERAGKQVSLDSLRLTHHPMTTAPGFWEHN